MSTDKLNEIAERLWEHPTLNGIRAALDEARQEDRAEIERLQESWIAESKLRQAAEAKLAEAQAWRRSADTLADEVAVLVQRGVIDSRSPAADALLDYRDPPSTPRTDALAAERAKTAALEQRLENAHDFGAKLMLDQMERAVRDGGKFSDERANRFVSAEARIAKLVEAAALKRNTIIYPGSDKQFVGTWVAVPEADFDALRAALAATKASEEKKP